MHHGKNESSNWQSSSRIQSKLKTKTQSNQFTIFLFFTSVKEKFMSFQQFTVTLLSPSAFVLRSTSNFNKVILKTPHISPLHKAFRVQGVYLILLPANKLWSSFSSKDITVTTPRVKLCLQSTRWIQMVESLPFRTQNKWPFFDCNYNFKSMTVSDAFWVTWHDYMK